MRRRKLRQVYKKRRGIYPRHPIFINLKSNTMKNTLQRYGFSPLKGPLAHLGLFDIKDKPFQVFAFRVIDVHRVVGRLRQLV